MYINSFHAALCWHSPSIYHHQSLHLRAWLFVSQLSQLATKDWKPNCLLTMGHPVEDNKKWTGKNKKSTDADWLTCTTGRLQLLLRQFCPTEAHPHLSQRQMKMIDSDDELDGLVLPSPCEWKYCSLQLMKNLVKVWGFVAWTSLYHKNSYKNILLDPLKDFLQSHSTYLLPLTTAFTCYACNYSK